MSDAIGDPAERAAAALVDALGRDKVLTGGAAYEAARTLWNRAVDISPAAIVRCRTRDDVRSAVALATASGCSLSVKGGGHHWAGRALTGRIVIDLAPMRRIEVAGNLATIEGGADSLEVATAAQRCGLAAVTGNLGGVGYAGLVLGGGYGPLTGRYGMASDSLVAADVVTADGTLVRATEDGAHADLLWALRGGGEALGVVTAMTVTLHPAAELLSGAVVHAWDRAADTARAFARAVADRAEDLTLTMAFGGGPDGAPVVSMLPAWSGPADDDGRIVAMLRAMGQAEAIDVSRKSYVDMLDDANAFVPDDTCALNRTVTLAELDPAAVRAIIAGVEGRSSPLSYVVVHPFHGAGERVSPDATAFGLRSAHYVVGICAVWRDGDPAPHRDWADRVEASLAPHGLDSLYPNYAGLDRWGGRAAPNGRDEARFEAVRSRYDPGGAFGSRPTRRP